MRLSQADWIGLIKKAMKKITRIKISFFFSTIIFFILSGVVFPAEKKASSKELILNTLQSIKETYENEDYAKFLKYLDKNFCKLKEFKRGLQNEFSAILS